MQQLLPLYRRMVPPEILQMLLPETPLQAQLLQTMVTNCSAGPAALHYLRLHSIGLEAPCSLQHHYQHHEGSTTTDPTKTLCTVPLRS